MLYEVITDLVCRILFETRQHIRRHADHVQFVILICENWFADRNELYRFHPWFWPPVVAEGLKPVGAVFLA